MTDIDRYGMKRPAVGPSQPATLVDVLDRVLDKGIVIAGDISISVVDIELLTIKLRLLIASADKAQQMGIDWWTSDPRLSSRAKELAEENESLRARLERLEQQMGELERGDAVPAEVDREG
jgi:hypothetical protein